MKTVFQSSWLSSGTCDGSPSSMYVFSTDNPTPSFYFEENWDYKLPHCGLSPFEYPVGCCISSMDLLITDGFSSFSAHFVDDKVSIENSAPTTVSNVDYCLMIGLTNTSIWGYQQASFLADEECIKGIQCSNNVLNIFNDTECLIPLEQFPISTFTNRIISQAVGQVDVTLVQYAGSIEIKYVADSPSWEAVPNYTSYLDYLTCGFYIFSIIATSLTVVFYAIKLRATNNFKTFYFTITQVLWTLKAIIQFYFTFTVFEVMDVNLQVYFFVCWLRVASLFTTLINVMLVFDIHKSCDTLRNRILAFGTVIMVHFGLNFLSYISPILYLLHQWDIALDTFVWSQTPSGIWNVLQFIVDIIPPIAIFQKLSKEIQARKHNGSVPSTYAAFTNLFITIGIQIANAVAYTLIQSLLDGSPLINSDKLNRTLTSFQAALLSINSIVILVIYEMLTVVLIEVMGSKYKPTPKKPKLIQSKQSATGGGPTITST
ncbi:hypothetical protein HDV06_004715 [Boothiomyces sp. JEL0866]|nr:hypothetical protein HDV06_004715 [Boothiomyces sp. JEL0866]